MRLDDVFAGVTSLGIDTAPFIYLVERHPAHVAVMREIVRRIDGGDLASYSSWKGIARAGDRGLNVRGTWRILGVAGKDRTMTEQQFTYQGRIVRDPEILIGKPVIKGTRIPVELVLAKLARNPDLTDLLADYPRLTVEDVKACLAYAQALVERENGVAKPVQSV